MKAAILKAQNDLEIVEIAKPSIQDHEVLIKVQATGICGSDVPRVLGNAASRYPIVLGHEFSGIVEEIGSRVSKVKLGQRVTGIPLLPCHQCVDCLQGNHAQCKHYSFVGSRKNGSWAEYVALPERNVLAVDKQLSFVEAAFIEPATVGLHALRHMKFRGGEHVLVIGAGTIGLLTMQWAKYFGARDITVIDIAEEQLELAKQLGATHTLNANEDDCTQRSAEITSGRGYPIVVDAAGVNATIKQAFHLVAVKGSVCLIGTSPTDLTFGHKEFELLNRKEFHLTGSWMSYSAPFPGDEWEIAHEAIKERKIAISPLLFREMRLEQIHEAFDYYRKGKNAPGKIMFTFD